MSIAERAPLVVVTFNVRMAPAADGPNRWELRRDLLREVIVGLAPDILCLQEPFADQIEWIAAALPGHRLIGVGREDGIRQGEWSAIFVRSDRCDVLGHGNFWLSETPEIPGSRSWDAGRHTRLCTWVHLRDHKTGARFRVFNSHWDHEGPEARLQSARLIAHRVAGDTDGLPAILTGDFNCTPESAPIQSLLHAAIPPFSDAFAAIGDQRSSEGTFHDFTGRSDGPRIDYILVTPGIEVARCEIIRERRASLYPSDHFPVRAELFVGFA